MRFAILAAAFLIASCGGQPVSRTLDLPTAGSGADSSSPFQANRGTAPPPPADGANAGQTAPPEGVGAGGVDFGQWRSADPNIYGPAFEAQMAQRFPEGTTRAAARTDLERNGFACTERADALECRIEIMEAQCAKDWYVALTNARARPHAGFDVMCLGAL